MGVEFSSYLAQSLSSSVGLSPFLLDCAVSISPVLRVAEPTNACSGIRVAEEAEADVEDEAVADAEAPSPALPIFCKVSCGGGRSLFAAIHTFPFPLCASRELAAATRKQERI